MKKLLYFFLLATCFQTLFAVRLTYKYTRSEPLLYELTMDSASTFISPDSGKRELKMKTVIRMKQELLEADADGYMKIAMTVLSATQEVNGVEKPFPAAQNQTQILRMKENGKILSTLTQIPGQAMDQDAMQMIFPESEVDVGFMWKQEKNIAQPLPVETQTLYKITEIKDKMIRISSIMKLKNQKGDSVQAQTKGNTLFDAEKGKIVESFADSKFQFEIPLRVPGLLPNNSNVKVTMHMKMHIHEIVEKKDKSQNNTKKESK
jgi:hypothetical protein